MYKKHTISNRLDNVKEISSAHNNLNIAFIEQRKDIKIFKGKRLAYKRKTIGITPDFSTKTQKSRRTQTDVLQTLRHNRW